MNVSLFNAPPPKKLAKSKLEEIVLRGFGGGWNVVDADTNMDAKYQPELLNLHRTPAGAQHLRFGTKLFSYTHTVCTGNIIDIVYFNNRLIVVTSTGQIASVDNNGNPFVLWTPTIAAALPGAPGGWSATTQVDFVPWKDQLIIHNGVDKPIIIGPTYVPKYLADLASGSNVNVPIGKFGCIASNYHCVAGLPASLTTVYISSKGTAGTFPGEAPPNDAISIDVGAYAPSGAPEILGIAGYRQYLIVFFRGQSLIVTLGEYNTATPPAHVPRFVDEMPQFGLVNHRCMATIENDLRFSGYDGMASAKRNLFSGNIDSRFLSSLIEPAWRSGLPPVPISQPYMVHNPIEHCTYLFTNDAVGTTYVYQANEQLKYESWTRYEGTGLRCVAGCKSFLGRVFLAGHVNGRQNIYQMGNDIFPGEQYLGDLLNHWTKFWANAMNFAVGDMVLDSVLNKSFKCNIAHQSALAPATFAQDRAANPAFWTEYLGENVPFTFELPWIDGRSPMRLKQLRFISIDTRGTAAFTVTAFVEFKGTPALTAQFVGNDALDGILSNDPQLYGFPLKFKTVKIRVTGSTKEQLTFAGLRYLFSKGRFRR